MTWNAKQRRWFKKYKKKQVAISCKELGTAPTKEASRAAANQWWENKLKELQANPIIRAKPSTRPIQTAEQAELAAEIGRVSPAARHAFADSVRRFDAAEAERAPLTDRSINAQINAFLARKEAQVGGSERTPGRWDSLRIHLAIFAKWMGANKPIEGITGRTVEDYHSHLLAVKKSAQYKRDIFASFKQFVRWAWGRELIDLPRNLSSKDFAFHVAPKKIRLFEIGELTSLLNAATDRTKLYILLMINCGMQQKDISDLRQDEVDWKQGRVIRKRSKTKKQKGVPEVDYLLWPETFRLLKAFRSKDPQRVLLTHEEKPLKQEEIIGRKVCKSDNIVSAYRRLVRDQMEIPKSKVKPLKLIRKTSSSLLESNPLFARFVDHFLGHSPLTLAQRHYAAPSREEFDKAIRWLGEQFSLLTASQ